MYYILHYFYTTFDKTKKHGVSVWNRNLFDLTKSDVGWPHQGGLCAMALGVVVCLAKQDWANRSVKISDSSSVESAVPASLLIKSAVHFHAAHVDVHDPVSSRRPAPNVSV